jgi:hypothetical protein
VLVDPAGIGDDLLPEPGLQPRPGVVVPEHSSTEGEHVLEGGLVEAVRDDDALLEEDGEAGAGGGVVGDVVVTSVPAKT